MLAVHASFEGLCLPDRRYHTMGYLPFATGLPLVLSVSSGFLGTKSFFVTLKGGFTVGGDDVDGFAESAGLYVLALGSVSVISALVSKSNVIALSTDPIFMLPIVIDAAALLELSLNFVASDSVGSSICRVASLPKFLRADRFLSKVSLRTLPAICCALQVIDAGRRSERDLKDTG